MSYSSLLSAAASNNQTEIQLLILENSPSDSDISDAIHFAAEVGKERSLAALLEHISRGSQICNEAFFTACRNGHLLAMQMLQRHHADINFVDPHTGLTPLMVAAQQGHRAILTHLLRSGCDMNLKTADENLTALHFAALNDHVSCIQLLISKGALSEECIYVKDSPLKMAALCGNEDSLEALVQGGAVVMPDAVDAAAMQNHHRCVQLLLKHNPNLKNNLEFQTSLLTNVLNRNYKETVEVLLQNGFNCNRIHNETMHTPLGLVSRKGLVDMVDVLVDHGADVDGLGCGSVTPLMIACAEARVEVAERLITRGSKVNFINKYGKSPMHYSVEGCHTEMARSTPQLQCLKLLLESGANPDVFTALSHMKRFARQDTFVVTPLYSALKFKNYEMLKLLLRANSSVHLEAVVNCPPTSMKIKPWQLCVNFCETVIPLALQMLFVAGLHMKPAEMALIPQSRLVELPWLNKLCQMPRSLKHLSRMSIRKVMGIGVAQKIEVLPLPSSVKLYLNLQELDWIMNDSYNLDTL